MQAPDEIEHFLRSYQISEGVAVAQKVNRPPPRGSTGGYLPTALAVVYEFEPLLHHPDRKLVNPRIALQLLAAIPLESSDRGYFFFSNTAAYSPLPYAPQAVGISFARMFSSSALIMSYAARLGNLAGWLVLCYLAVLVIPFMKWAMVAVMLLPMSVFLAASASADACTNGLLWLFVALTLRSFGDTSQAVMTSHRLSLFAVAMLVGLLKIPYQCLALLPLVVAWCSPPHRQRQSWISAILIWGAMGFSAATWLFIAAKTFSPYHPSFDPVAQLRYLAPRPSALLWGTFGYLQPYFFWRTVTQCIGVLGSLDAPFPPIFYAVHVLVLIVAVAYEPTVLSFRIPVHLSLAT